MALSKRQVDVEITDDEALQHLRVLPVEAEWSRTSTMLGDAGSVCAVSFASEAGKDHVVKTVTAGFDNGTAVGRVIVQAGAHVIRHRFVGATVLQLNLRAAANTTVSGSLTSGSSVSGDLNMTGYTIDV